MLLLIGTRLSSLCALMVVSVLVCAAKGAATPAPESRALRPGGHGLVPSS